MKNNAIVSSMAAFALVVALGASGPAAADSNPSPFVGTFFSLAETGGVEGGLAITLFKDGNANLLWSAGTTELVGNAFTNEVGVWKETGPREITARSVDFNFLYPTDQDPKGVILGNAIDTWVITFDHRFDTFSGTFAGTVYTPDVDPINPGDAEPLYTFGGSFDGSRLTVD